jgi:tetratricopeptide (TPR) repeat protein
VNVERGEAGARRHFQRSLELYRAGHYTAALEELEQAARLDPNGKDLFFNLSLVHEKLGQLPEAIAALERFRQLETDRTERERARLTIERLRGAERAGELARTARASEPCPERAVPAPAPPPAAPRTTPILIGAASVAAVSFVVGTIFGAKAWSDDVEGQSTSPTFSIMQLRERARRAEREALVADIAFAISAASAATFVGVWWLSPKDPAVRAAGLTVRGYF